MRTKSDTFFSDFPQFTKAENLESAGVGKNRAGPGHEPVQAAEFPHLLHAGTQVQMVGIPQKDLHAEIFQDVLGHAFDGSDGANGHKHGGVDIPVRGTQCSAPPVFAHRLNVEFNRHFGDCKGTAFVSFVNPLCPLW